MVRKGKKLEFISLHGITLRHNDDCRCRMLARLFTGDRARSPDRSIQFGGSLCGGRIESLWADPRDRAARRTPVSAKWESPSRDLFQILS